MQINFRTKFNARAVAISAAFFLTTGLVAVGAQAASAASAAAAKMDQSHALWTQVLQKYQTEKGLLRYKQLKADSAKDPKHPFNVYVASIQAVPYKEYQSWTKEQRMAFLINSYNALTVKLILKNYPVASIKKIGGFFTKPWSVEFFSLLDGKIKSLDPIEHEWLRPQFKDFRVHAAVNCASISCPPLRHEAFVADRLSAQLDGQMRAWLADTSRNRIKGASAVWEVSKIFDWYGDDFETWGGGVQNVINKYLKKPISPKVLKTIKIKYLPYNWDLNEAH